MDRSHVGAAEQTGTVTVAVMLNKQATSGFATIYSEECKGFRREGEVAT